MANDPLAAAHEPPSEDEYQAFVLALSESARGRALLAEHVQRSRAAESDMLLSSVQRLEALVLSQNEVPVENPVGELRDMLMTIRDVQANLDVTLTAQVSELAALIEGVQQRIESLALPAAEVSAPVEAQAESELASPFDAPSEDDIAATPLPEIVDAVVEAADVSPEAEETELEATALVEETALVDLEALSAALEANAVVEPEPEEAETQPEPTDLVEDQTVEERAMVEFEEAFVIVEVNAAAEPEAAGATPPIPDVAPPKEAVAAKKATTSSAPAAGLAIAALVETLAVPKPEEAQEVTVYKAGSIPQPAPYAGEDFAAGKRGPAVPPTVDPLADIMALSDDERLALFT